MSKEEEPIPLRPPSKRVTPISQPSINHSHLCIGCYFYVVRDGEVCPGCGRV